MVVYGCIFLIILDERFVGSRPWQPLNKIALGTLGNANHLNEGSVKPAEQLNFDSYRRSESKQEFPDNQG